VRYSLLESPQITRLNNPAELRSLAAWYRDQAEASENPSVWDGRHRTARELERMATAAEARSLPEAWSDQNPASLREDVIGQK
jgi:hypothetical protein